VAAREALGFAAGRAALHVHDLAVAHRKRLGGDAKPVDQRGEYATRSGKGRETIPSS